MQICIEPRLAKLWAIWEPFCIKVNQRMLLLYGILVAHSAVGLWVGKEANEPLECLKDYTSPTEQEISRAKEMMSEYGVIDGHNDLPMTYTYRDTMNQDLSKLDLNSATIEGSETTIPLAKEGLLRGQFWSIYWSCKSNYKDGVQWAMEQIDLTKRFIAQYPEMEFVRSVAEARDAMKSKTYKIASTMGLEGGHMIGSSLATLRMFYELGIRYMTLTHNCDTPWATESHTEAKNSDVGLSDFGRKIVKEMNRIGMIIDLSHVSQQTMLGKPLLLSHLMFLRE